MPIFNKGMIALLGISLLAACSASSEKAADKPRELSATLATVQKAAALPDPHGFRRDLGMARAVFVVSPNSGGVALARGVASNTLSAPAFYAITQVDAGSGGAGTGFSRVPQKRELVAAFMTQDSLQWLMAPTLPGRAGLRVAAGAASPEEKAQADVVVLDLQAPQARQPNLDLTLITIDAQANQAFYSKPVAPAEIFTLRAAPDSQSAALQQAIQALGQERKP